MNYQEIFKRLWEDYIHQNPAAGKIHKLFTDAGEKVENDHIAFRTFNDPRMNIDVLAKVFIKNGYVEKGQYVFKEKHLFARHYEHSGDKKAPRVFISELILQDFSDSLQNIVNHSINQVPDETYRSDDLIFSGSLFPQPSFEVYSKLREESEYAAWLYVFGFRANHFTVSVNALKKYNTIEKLNEFIKAAGFKLNTSGGEIKGTKADLLRQSSTLADQVKVSFTEGVFEIPACYYEFAERFKDANGHYYSGFIASSADKIFESTNFYKK
ncbi:MAG: DUF1338 domain-containing protein [Bacteroidales bacterium]|nr:DUF1338 domain-containing protein [Bacteroidales bacterium]MCB9013725.1 DUF1338 domain-containing protein [Bacteroidales bacterium]